MTSKITTPRKDEMSEAVVRIPPADEQQLDFIGPSNAVKDLFALPYSLDKGVSVAVHNMNGTLLIDADSIVYDSNASSRRKKRPRAQQQPSLPQEETTNDALAVVTSMLQLEHNVSDDADRNAAQQQDGKGTTNESRNRIQRAGPGELMLPQPEDYTSVPRLEEPREYLSWKFRGLNLMVGSDALVCRHPEQDALAIRIQDRNELQAIFRKHKDMSRAGQFVPDYRYPTKTYADALAPKPKQIEAEKAKSYAPPSLKQVELQTCIVPSSNTSPLGSLLSRATVETTPTSSPVCTVMDVYLDNIMANVPQLALCLRDKGYIQSVKLLKTEQIPSTLMHASTLDPLAALPDSDEPPIFSPQIMEMNASTLLQFLKSNCTRDNATYLLRREAGESDVQLFDVTAISASRQRKWVWWLAMMSYRFAMRLGQLSTQQEKDAARTRQFRARRRSLLTTTLELLHDLNDMDGGAHETLCASVEEHLADTFLSEDCDGPHPSMPFQSEATSQQHPYPSVSIDSLNKAQDHLTSGIRMLWALLNHTQEHEKQVKETRDARRQEVVRVRVHSEDSSSSDDDNSDESDEEHVSYEIQSISMQLFGLLHKSINVSLRLAEHHLQNYFSSSAMRELRSAARRIADGITLLQYMGGDDEVLQLQNTLLCQYSWLWEQCGHFARSFAADELWRERGHACGDDIISVLRDAEAALSLSNISRGHARASSWMEFIAADSPLTKESGGSVRLRSVSAVVDSETTSASSDIGNPTKLLERQKPIQRDMRRVLVSACVSYSRAICAIQKLTVSFGSQNESPLCETLQQRLGDACNEIGKILLNEVRALLSVPASQTGVLLEDRPSVADALLSSADFWFKQGLKAFQDCGDTCNIALLRCNLCQCCKLRTNSSCSLASAENASEQAESRLQDAIEHLQKAHDALGEREPNPRIWDMVSEELAATFLVLGVRRRQNLVGGGTMPVIAQSLRLSPGKEKSIVDPMERAMEIYSQLGNSHQEAAAHYQLALFYSKVWTCQRDEAKTREKLAKAFEHFGMAHSYFSRAPAGNESTFVILSLDLANLYAVVSGKEGLSKALSCCLDTAPAFSFEAIDAALERQEKGDGSWFEKMGTLASSLEEQIFKFLVSLVKLEKESNDTEHLYREMYRTGLKAKMAMKMSNEHPGTPDYLSSFHELLVSIK